MMMMTTLGFRESLSVKYYSIQVWLGQIMGHHFWLSNHSLHLHDGTPLNEQGERKADRKKDRETEINTQTQLDIPDPLSLLYYCYYYVIILDLQGP